MFVLDTTEIAGPAAVETIGSVKKIGHDQLRLLGVSRILTQSVETIGSVKNIGHDQLRLLGVSRRLATISSRISPEKTW